MKSGWVTPFARGKDVTSRAMIRGGRTVCPLHPAIVLGVLLAVVPAAIAQDTNPSLPNFEARKHRAEYVGPGREESEPRNLTEIGIAYFGPEDPAHAAGGSVRQGVELALEEANREGGYRGISFRLIGVWSENPWGTGISSLTRAVYYDRVWGIIGGIDGPSTHLAEQVVVKARLPLLSPVSSDKTANLANVPWIFSISPGDHQIAPVIADGLMDLPEASEFVVVSANDHDSELLFREVNQVLQSRHSTLPHHIQFRSGEIDPGLPGEVLRLKPRVVVILAGVEDSARLLTALRVKGYDGNVIGGPAMSREAFRAIAGTAAEGVLFPAPDQPGEGAAFFDEAFRRRYGTTPDYAAAQGYDAVRLLVAAIRKAGLNRPRIADAVRATSPWPGVSGSITWDPTGQNTRPVRLARYERGLPRFVDDQQGGNHFDSLKETILKGKLR